MRHTPLESVYCHSVRREEREFYELLNKKIFAIRENINNKTEGVSLFNYKGKEYILFNGRVLPENNMNHLCHLTCSETFGYDSNNIHNTLSYSTWKDIDKLCELLVIDEKCL